MKHIGDSSHFDDQGSTELIKNYYDAAFELKKHLRFDGDRFKIIDNCQLSDNTWRFTVESLDKSQNIYLSSSSGIVKHILHV